MLRSRDFFKKIMKGIIELDEDNFKKEILEVDVPTMVVFWKPGCNACSVIFPIIKEVAEEMDGKAKFGELNIIYSHEIAKKYKIPAIPTLIIFKNGKVMERAIGLRSKKTLIDKIHSLTLWN